MGPTQVSVLIARYEKNEDAEVTLPTLKAIAKGAEVSAAWLILGTGSPDADDDARAPSTRESELPRRGNVIGWDDALAVVRAKHKFTDDTVASGERVAALTTRGIITPEEVLQILRLVAQQSDPARMERQLAEAYERQRQVLADADAREAEAEAREKTEKVKPKGGRKPKGGQG